MHSKMFLDVGFTLSGSSSHAQREPLQHVPVSRATAEPSLGGGSS